MQRQESLEKKIFTQSPQGDFQKRNVHDNEESEVTEYEVVSNSLCEWHFHKETDGGASHCSN